MPTILNNGIQLPDKGSVDWYSSMQSNYNLIDTHLGDTDTHVTAEDKANWNNGVSQAYVLRYSNTAITDNSTIAYSTLDNTDNIKASDKIIDSDGKIFSIASVDTTNQTVTVGSALVDLALDSNVVHTSGNETVSGQKIFDDINAISNTAELGVSAGNNSFKVLDKNKNTISRYEGGTYSYGMAYSYFLVNNGSDVFNGVSLYQASANLAQLRPYSSTLSMQLGASNRYFSDCYTSKVNGLTPSSLGMPVAPSSTSYVDISGYITVLDSSSANTYTPPSNGYITFAVTGNQVQIFHDNGLQGKWSIQADSTNRGFIPVLGGVEVKIYVTASSIDKFWFIPCKGNV